jgi:hypothetical protein
MRSQFKSKKHREKKRFILFVFSKPRLVAEGKNVRKNRVKFENTQNCF